MWRPMLSLVSGTEWPAHESLCPEGSLILCQNSPPGGLWLFLVCRLVVCRWPGEDDLKVNNGKRFWFYVVYKTGKMERMLVKNYIRCCKVVEHDACFHCGSSLTVHLSKAQVLHCTSLIMDRLWCLKNLKRLLSSFQEQVDIWHIWHDRDIMYW